MTCGAERYHKHYLPITTEFVKKCNSDHIPKQAKSLTFEEYKASQKKLVTPQVVTRKLNEGVDPSVLGEAVVLKKEEEFYSIQEKPKSSKTKKEPKKAKKVFL